MQVSQLEQALCELDKAHVKIFHWQDSLFDGESECLQLRKPAYCVYTEDGARQCLRYGGRLLLYVGRMHWTVSVFDLTNLVQSVFCKHGCEVEVTEDDSSLWVFVRLTDEDELYLLVQGGFHSALEAGEVWI